MEVGSSVLTIGSCFSGIGGLELGLEWTGGFETKWQIEMDPYASKVLEKHWPNVKRYSDIRDVSFPERVDVICGGFPCQDVSLAGARKGLEGKRSTLWGEMFRLVCEVKPRLVVAENVPGLLSSDDGRFFGNILRDLAGAGYDVEWRMLSAASVGALHLRKRVFILGHTNVHGRDGTKNRQSDRARENGDQEGAHELRQPAGSSCPRKKNDSNARLLGSSEHEIEAAGTQQLGQTMADPEFLGWETRPNETRNGENFGASNIPQYGSRQWTIEPNVGRVANGVPFRVDRLKCLGNAVVPQVAQKIGEMILNYEKKNK